MRVWSEKLRSGANALALSYSLTKLITMPLSSEPSPHSAFPAPVDGLSILPEAPPKPTPPPTMPVSHPAPYYTHILLNSVSRGGTGFEQPACSCLKDSTVNTKTCLLSQISTFKWFSNVVASWRWPPGTHAIYCSAQSQMASVNPPQESRPWDPGNGRLCEHDRRPLPWTPAPQFGVRTSVCRTRRKLTPHPPRPVEGTGAVVDLGRGLFFTKRIWIELHLQFGQLKRCSLDGGCGHKKPCA